MAGLYANLEHCSDIELIDRMKSGEEFIMDYICERYKGMVISKAKSMFILGGDKDDLIQEGMIGLFKAVRDFDCGRDASFATFADLCISRQMYSAVQAAKRKKHLPLNSYISLEGGDDEGSGNDSQKAGEWLAGSVGINPEEMVLDRERTEYLERAINEELSEFERQVLDLFLTGMSYVQIARVLGREEKATDNALQRLKAKIKKIVLKEDS